MSGVRTKRIFSQNSKSCTDFFCASRLPILAMRDRAARTLEQSFQTGPKAAGTHARCGERGGRGNGPASFARLVRADRHCRISLDFLEVRRREGGCEAPVAACLFAHFLGKQGAFIASEMRSAAAYVEATPRQRVRSQIRRIET